MSTSGNDVFLQEQNPISLRWAVFEDDGTSAWLYLTKPDLMEPIGDCWIYNRIPAPKQSELGQYRGGPPPACEGYAVPGSQYSPDSCTELCFIWSADGNAVAIKLDDVVFGFVSLTMKQSCSRNIANAGPWGNPWDEERFQKIFDKKIAK